MSLALAPYVPRLLIDWQIECPDEPYRQSEGSLVFVDLSGFTRMSERLARIGKAGSEEVAYVINSSFQRLLSIAWDDGGGLIKFGGDALLLFFSGRDHAVRACRSTCEMRRSVRAHGRIQTAAGQVSLRMSAGVHSGLFHFFLAGRSHRELILTGPGASRTAAMEGAAEAGEAVVSRETASLVGSRLLGAERDGGYLLKRRPELRPGTAIHSLPERLPDLRPFLPLALRPFLGAGEAEGEHRQITVAFLHFRGVDALLECEGPAAVQARLDALVSAVQAVADEHGVCFLGTDIAPDGGKIILVAGAPTTSANDEERMLRVVSAIASGDAALPLQIGVNRGRAFAGEIGPVFRRTYTVMGDAVNLAARLMQAARPGQVLTTPEVLDSSRTVFQSARIEPLRVKGKSHPVQACTLGEMRGIRRSESAALLPLAGRETEMAALLSALDSGRRGRGVLVEISGEAGIGKSRLLAELESRRGDALYLAAACEQYESSTPYFAFRQLLRSLIEARAGAPAWQAEQLPGFVRSRAPELAPWLPLLATPLDVAVPETPECRALDPGFRTTRLHQVVADLLETLLAGPSIIALEDVHWMDGASAALLGHIAYTLPQHPWLVCATRRSQSTGFLPGPDLPRVTIPLAPLSAADAITLAACAVEQDPLPQHQLELAARRAEGNPLFLKQLLTAARSADADDALPESMESAIVAEIDRLGGEHRRMLRYASVIGPSFSLDLLSHVAPELGGVSDPASWTPLLQFVRPQGAGRFAFTHALIRDAAYEGLPFRRRRELHGRVGEALEQQEAHGSEELVELLSLHFHRAQRHDEAWRYSLLAGDRARAKFANVEAAKFYRRALQAAPRCADASPSEALRVSESLGDVLELAGLYAEAKEAYRRGRLQAGAHSPASTRFVLKEGVVCDRLGRYTQALRWYSRGLRSLAEGGEDRRAVLDRTQLYLYSAAARYRQGRYRDCIRWCQRVLAETGQGGDKASQARAYYLLDAAYTDLGSPESARYRALALPIYEELGDLIGQANVLNNLGIDAYYEGRWDDALQMYERSKQAREKAGDVVGAATATNNIGEILSDQGRLEEAERAFAKALRVWRAARYSVGIAIATSNLGRSAARAGRLEEAVRLLDEAASLCRRIGAENLAVEAAARKAEALVMWERSAEALPALDSTLERARAMGGMAVLQALLHRLRGRALWQLEERDSAWRCLEESERLARSVTARYELGQTLAVMAEFAGQGGHPRHGRYEREATAILSSLGVVSGR